MASCITAFWSPTESTPRVRLTVTQTASTETTATLTWKFEYVASSYAVSTSIAHACKAVVNGQTVFDGTYAINGKTGTHTIKSGTVTVNKGTSAKNVTFSCSMDFSGILWSEEYWGSNKSASGTISVAAKTSYKITYNANGGSGAPAAQTKWHGTNLTLSSTKPTRTGYSFVGWALTDAEADAGTYYYLAGGTCGKNENLTLYAVWKANTYSVTYNANGGSGAPAKQTKTYGVTLKLSSTKPTRTNYTFKGWGTSASATSVAYAAGANYTQNAAITLYAIWELSYVKPRLTNLSVTRCDTDGNVSDSGTFAKVVFDWATDRAVSSITVEALASSTVIHTTDVVFEGTSGNVSVVVGDGALSAETTYTIRITVTDELQSVRKSLTLPGLRLGIDLKVGGRGIAFGKPAEMDDFVGFGWDACFNNYLGIHGVDLDGNVKQVFQPQNENGNTVVGWDNYDLKSGNTNIYGHDVYIGVANIATPDMFRPYRRQGDSLSYSSLRTAGYVTNSGKDVTFLVPFAVPILGGPTATPASNSGFVLRQGEKYTHGSGASTYVIPDSYSATVSAFVGVYVTAHFSDTTNVINNAPIGIYWSGTITFT